MAIRNIIDTIQGVDINESLYTEVSFHRTAGCECTL